MLDFALLILVVLICIAAKGSNDKTLSREAKGKAWLEADKTDIDPVTGDWTSRYDGMRYDKYGVVKWRD